MTDVRCPMCGEPNPADNEVCQFCQARIKPLTADLTESESGEGWVGERDKSADDQHKHDQPSTEPEKDDSDWLSDIFERDTLSEGGDAPLFDETEDDSDNWLRRIQADVEDEDALEMSSDEPIDDQDDWLLGLYADSEAETSPEQQFDSEVIDLPDWLSGEDKDSQEEAVAGKAYSEGEVPSAVLDDDTLPEWLDNEGDESLPDWLNLEEGKKPESETAVAEPVDEGLNEWLDDTPVLSTEESIGQSTTEEPSFDWLSDDQDAGMPDWLSAEDDSDDDTISGEAETLAPESAISEGVEAGYVSEDDEMMANWLAGSEGEQLPEWLETQEEDDDLISSVAQLDKAGVSDRFSNEDADAGEETPDETADEMPDWLDEAVGMPDWLQTQERESELRPGEILEPDTGVTEQPDRKPDEASSGEETDTKEENALPDWLDIDYSDGEEWLDETTDEFELDFADEQAFDFLSDNAIDDDLDWLADADLADISVDGELVTEEEAPASSEGLPGWIGKESVEEDAAYASEQDLDSATTQPGEDLTPADLPSWLEAMRPVDTLDGPILPADATMVEGAGPLAGLQGVLPAEPDISYVRKPAAYSIKLRVSDIQQKNAALLKQLVDKEGDAQPITTRPVVTSQYLLRVSVFVVLVLTILLSLITAMPQLTVPVGDPAYSEALAVSQLIATLPPGAPVLVAVDYEPGWAGELDLVTGVVLDDLMRRGAYLTFVSTVPTGPIQTERLVAITNQSGNYQYSAPGMYANLGFIPGGAAGIQNFAVNPRRTIVAALSDWSSDVPVWQGAGLSSVNELSDFKLLVIASENPDTVRIWVEQTQVLRTGDLPLVVVTSQQALPMVQPYYQAKPQQVNGLISGLTVGTVYESMLGHSDDGKAGLFLSPFSMGTFIVAVLIAVGASVNALTLLLARRKEDAGDGK